jgi:transcriptional regulator with XRE-family HTH domain
VENGWDIRELAQRAGVSRTTLHHILSGATRRPHLATLGRLAAALGVEPAELGPRAGARRPPRPTAPPVALPLGEAAAGDFDRETNPAVCEVSRDQPGLFAGWSRDEWDELYSTFGVGGQLTSEGVTQCARAINARRETTRQLHVVLETHLAEVARQFVQTLYEMVRPSDGLEICPTPAAP